MQIRPLPPEVMTLLQANRTRSRLIAHLTLVHDVAVTLTQAITQTWPALSYDAPAILFGAASHDIGKTVHPAELSADGHRHEQAGRELLITNGYPDHLARYAETHGSWNEAQSPTLEDLLVALTDTIWKGKRDERLEGELCQRIATAAGLELWQVYISLDDILSAITAEADQRLQWQNEYRA